MELHEIHEECGKSIAEHCAYCDTCTCDCDADDTISATTSVASAAIDSHGNSTVVAEDAPIGVLLWPVINAKFAPNFTLASVSIVRDAYGRHVLWTYESGTTRTFHLGEQIAVRYTA